MGAAPAPGGCLLPRDREVRLPAHTPGPGTHGLGLGDGRLLEILYLLRRALHPGRGDQSSLRRCDRGGRGTCGAGGAGGQSAGSERERVPRRHARRGGRRPGAVDPLPGRHRGYRPHPLYHFTPGGAHRFPGRGLCGGARAGEPSASAGAKRFRSCPGSHETGAYGARV